ncbi:Stf0 family sulfotransferase [Polymorphobacter fuscus]|nr:Stf0 family sulfotransferase [Polymorphobacter fuscus]NJC07837.1 LPS sulfotransferase NodH [Polymorphobacter fuscus]
MADIEGPVLIDPWDKDGLALDRLDPLPALPFRYPDGWMRPIELRILYTLARRSAGPVLEVGSWIGRSSSAIAAGLRDGVCDPKPVYDIIDFGPCSAAEWQQRFGQKLNIEMGGGHVAAAVLHPGGSMAVLIDNMRRNDLLGHVTSIIRGDVLETPLGRRYGMIFCDAVHGEVEAKRTMPAIAALAAERALFVFDDVTTEAFADTICSYLKPVRRFLLSGKDTYGKLLVVEHHAPAAPAKPAGSAPRPVPSLETARQRRAAAGAIWRDTFAAHGIERSVILASTFRSGSTYVSSLLAANGLPGLSHERFADAWRHIVDPPGEAFGAFLNTALSDAHGGCFATKLMWPHLARLAEATGHGRDEAADLGALFRPARWIQVCRADKVAQAVSFWRAKMTGRWQVYATEAEPEPEYDFLAIRNALHEIELGDRLWDDFFARAGIEPLRVTYEALVADLPGGLSELLSALGLPAEVPAERVGLRRQRDSYSKALQERFLGDFYRV